MSIQNNYNLDADQLSRELLEAAEEMGEDVDSTEVPASPKSDAQPPLDLMRALKEVRLRLKPDDEVDLAHELKAIKAALQALIRLQVTLDDIVKGRLDPSLVAPSTEVSPHHNQQSPMDVSDRYALSPVRPANPGPGSVNSYEAPYSPALSGDQTVYGSQEDSGSERGFHLAESTILGFASSSEHLGSSHTVSDATTNGVHPEHDDYDRVDEEDIL